MQDPASLRSRAVISAALVAASLTIGAEQQQQADIPTIAPHLQYSQVAPPARRSLVLNEMTKDSPAAAPQLIAFATALDVSDAVSTQMLPTGETLKQISVAAVGAEWIRLSLTDVDLPVGARLFVYSPDAPSETKGPFQGAGPEGDGSFWLPAVRGQTAILEYIVPPGMDAQQPTFRVASAEYGSVAKPGPGNPEAITNAETKDAAPNVASDTPGYAIHCPTVRAVPDGFLQVDWTANVARPSVTDWIGLYNVGGADAAYYSFQYTPGGEAGTVFFILPAAVGTYEVRFYINDSFTKVATTRPIVVDHVVLNLAQTSTTVSSLSGIGASWMSDTTRSNVDWVGLYQVGAADAAYVAFSYIPPYFVQFFPPNPALSSGSLFFVTPAIAGDYELRFFSNDSYTKLATSPPFTVGYSLPPTPERTPVGTMYAFPWAASEVRPANDWMGLFRIDNGDATWQSFDYTGGGVAGQVNLAIPGGVGRYEARYFSDGGFTKRVTGNHVYAFNPTFTSLFVSRTSLVPGGIVRANWGHNTASSQTDWIGMYATGAANSAYLSFQYVQGGASGQRSFVAPAVGTYEVRAFENNTYDLERTSTFAVVAGCISAPTAIAFNTSVNGAIAGTDCRSAARGSNNYADRYSFSGVAGQQINITMFGTSGAAIYDTYLELIGPDGTVVAENDNASSTLGARIPQTANYFTLPQTGTYIIEATSFGSNTTGSYRLTLNKL